MSSPRQRFLELDTGDARPDGSILPVNGAARSVGLSLVIPVHDEAGCLEELWKLLRPVLDDLPRQQNEVADSWEVIFIDDGSTDGSLSLLSKIGTHEPRVRVIKMDRWRGQSAALDAGFRAARGQWIMTLDADLQTPPAEIPRLLAAAGNADLVYGWRRRRHDRWLKRVTSRIGNVGRNLITGHRVHDTGCSLKLFRSAALARIPRFNGMHRFLPSLFVFHGFRILEIEVEHRQRFAGRSKYGLLDRAWQGIVDCLAVRWLRRRALDYRATSVPKDQDSHR